MVNVSPMRQQLVRIKELKQTGPSITTSLTVARNM
jgi:hypothetical protein